MLSETRELSHRANDSPFVARLNQMSNTPNALNTSNVSNTSIMSRYLNKQNIFWSHNTSAHNQSYLSQTGLLSDSNRHSIRSYNSVLPVLVIEAISSDAFSFSTLSVKICDFGWAWLVCGRRLFLWKYKQLSGNRISNSPCYELQLPPSDLSHKADLVCVFYNKDKSHVPSTMAVSPEGIIRFWPNIAYEGHSIETTATDLQGQECISLTDIQPLGCILGTTTSSLVHITVNNSEGQNAIMCRILKIPQGMLTGFGRKVSSFIFGAMPATQSSEAKQLIRVVPTNLIEANRIDLEQYIWVLSSYSIQKWKIIDQNLDRLMEDFDLERAVKEMFLEKVWNRETTHPNQLQIWTIDMALRKANEIVLLVAALNADVSNQVYYAIATITERSLNLDSNRCLVSSSFTTFNVMRNHTVCYSEDDIEQLLSLHLLSPTINNQAVYIYDNLRILCVQLNGDEVDVIEFNARDDCILGAGVCDGYPLLFTQKDALISIIPHKQDISDLIDVSRRSDEMYCTDDRAAIKRAFIMCTKGDQARSQLLVNEAFPLLPGVSENNNVDEAVVSLSVELCDEMPHSDPRWAESNIASNVNENITASLVMTNQLEEKVRVHRSLIEFLKAVNIWERLTSLVIKGVTVSTKLVLCEYAEKLVAALTLRKLHIDYNHILDSAIKIVLHDRNASIDEGLTAQDVFYRQTTRVDDLIWAMVEYETDRINNELTNGKEILKFIMSVSHILTTVFQEVCHFRQTQAVCYESLSSSNNEYIPWSAITGTNGVRTALLKQFDLLINYGIESPNVFTLEEDIQLKGAIYQKIVELADIILDGYVCQLKSIDKTGERYQIIKRNFEACRTKCLRPLIKMKQYDRAAALAEKYDDFDALILICEQLNSSDRLQRYIIDYSNKNFAEYLFNWYAKQGKHGKMLSTLADTPMLTNFLQNYEQLNWIHQIHCGQLEAASNTLKKLAVTEERFLARKKTLLSLSKLSAIAAGNTDYSDIDSQLQLLECYESS